MTIIITEIQKWKRNKIVWCILALTLLLGAFAIERACSISRSSPFMDSFGDLYTLAFKNLSSLFLPIVLGMFATTLFFDERKNDTMKELLIIPITKAQLYFSKVAVVILMSVGLCLITFLLCVVGGLIAGGFPDLNAQTLMDAGLLYLAGGILIPIAMLPIVFLSTLSKGYEEAAQVVRRIFDMTLEGFGTEQIATQFEKEGILTPQAYWIQKGIGRPGKTKTRPATKWNGSTITHLLYQQEYCGDILNFKTYSKSYKNKKRIHNDPENWVVFKDVHEPIIERAVFEQVQQKRGKMRKRCTSNGEHNMFSGLLVCADCGCNLHFHFNQGNPEIKYFNCSNYKGNRGTCQSTHYIRVDFLEEVVLGEIRRLTKFASLYEDDFLKAVIGHSQLADEADRKLKEKELKTLLARDEELDGLFERIYEDNVSGKISDERFSRMSRRYEDEQKELTEKIKQLRSEIEKQSSRTMTTDMFISLVRKYTRAKKLTPRMLNELVEKIEVFNAEKVNGVWEQRLRIHYNCVGTIEIPSALPLPTPDVSVNTRKGVVVNYAPCDVAI